ncbi:hypothetical protein NA57DRAFT_75677 [Rhizodiscina lignyota]|uniref:Uncharacterized protein n=1 Tax=Rhizodiscina lignyota TaxID=1504668 RepID=A0A9P4IFN1_9PEZI|nr:hypothetical protein NA57DRAFT_75677 [Rhizodiscina lignyota]
MKFTTVLGCAMLFGTAALATPVVVEEAREVAEDYKTLEKRTGHIDVTTWKGNECGGTNQGTTQVGTGGKCVNMSNAGSFSVGGSSDINPSGCKVIHVQYYLNTGCHGTKGITQTVNGHSCHALSPNQGSAHMVCKGS